MLVGTFRNARPRVAALAIGVLGITGSFGLQAQNVEQTLDGLAVFSPMAVQGIVQNKPPLAPKQIALADAET